MWKDFFYFTRAQRQGVIVLVVLIVSVFAACWLVPPRENNAGNDMETFQKEYDAFVASISERKRDRRVNYAQQNRGREVILAPFDPNTVDSVTFLNLGLPSWMAKNILRYRAKGGAFRRAEDFKKIYGLTEEQYTVLLPYLHIPESYSVKDTVRLYTRTEKRDTVDVYKYPAGTVVDLNRADTTELKKIPGIGRGIARMIVGYRTRLGGFYDVNQLEEVHLAAKELSCWFTVTPGGIRRLNLNKASIERLKAHPYINFYQAKVIVEYRRKKGNLHSLKQLSLYEEFTPEDMERIGHYVCFE